VAPPPPPQVTQVNVDVGTLCTSVVEAWGGRRRGGRSHRLFELFFLLFVFPLAEIHPPLEGAWSRGGGVVIVCGGGGAWSLGGGAIVTFMQESFTCRVSSSAHAQGGDHKTRRTDWSRESVCVCYVCVCVCRLNVLQADEEGRRWAAVCVCVCVFTARCCCGV